MQEQLMAWHFNCQAEWSSVDEPHVSVEVSVSPAKALRGLEQVSGDKNTRPGRAVRRANSNSPPDPGSVTASRSSLWPEQRQAKGKSFSSSVTETVSLRHLMSSSAGSLQSLCWLWLPDTMPKNRQLSRLVSHV